MIDHNGSRGMNRRKFLQIAGPGLALTNASQSLPASASSTTPGMFPFGTHIYREPSLPLEQIREDLPLLKKLGFNMVKIQESWAIDEQKEGEIDLSKVSRVVSDARQVGLGVYFGVTMEQAPAWFWRKFPDAYLVYNTGEPHNDQLQYVIPADGKPGPCWHHPGARNAASRFLGAVGREVGQYDNILVWNVWQEIGFWPMRPGFLGFCYCPNSLREFRTWLQDRYGSIEKVNQAWRSGYASFDEVIPPRLTKDLPPYVDFRYFMDDIYLPYVLQWKASALRSGDPQHRPVFAHADGAIVGSGQQWQQAKVLDFYGASCYPAWTPFDSWDAGQGARGGTIDPHQGQQAELWNAILLRFDYLRSVTPGGKIWAAEFQGGPVVRGLHRGRVPSAADIRRWVLGALAAGVQGISFWNHRAEIFWREENGFGLLELEGSTITPRAEEAGRLAKAIHQHAELFAQGKVPQAEVAILISEELYIFLNATLQGENFAAASDHSAHTMRGIHRSLWNQGVPVDFLVDTQLAEHGNDYKVLILTMPAALNPDLIQELRQYVEQGGTLVSEACPGRLNEYGFAAPGAMPTALRELFGATHRDLAIVREPRDGSIWTGREASYGDTVRYRDLQGAGEFRDYSVMPAYFLQTLNATTATPVLQDGDQVAGCHHLFGKGHAYLIGTLLGHATLSYEDPRNERFLKALLTRHGVRADRAGKLNRRRRVLGQQAAWFLFNNGRTPVEESISVAGYSSVTELLTGPLASEAGHVRIVVDPQTIRCLVLRT